MGDSVNLSLINNTNIDWVRVKSESYQMNHWNFPEKIKSKSATEALIERSDWILNDHNLDTGMAEYKLLDSNESSLQVIAKYHNDKGLFVISIYFKSLRTDGNLPGSTLILGWYPDSIVTFILSGEERRYTGTNLKTESWMNDNWKLLGDLPLESICITGSHDAGMSKITSKTGLSSECNTLTQTHDILGQLNLGIRYFDIRPVISDGHFLTGHYAHLALTWQGANGESIQSMIDAINTFTQKNNELIIIRLAHTLNTDLGNNSYRPFTKEEWGKLFTILDDVNYLYHHDEAETNKPLSLSQITLNKFTDNGSHAAVLFIVGKEKDSNNNINLGERYKKGFFYFSDLNMYNKYSNTNDFKKMSDDQIAKMNKYSKNKYFLLSWTLTQNSLQSAGCPLPLVKSIKEMAEYANQHLSTFPYRVIDSSSYPNIIHVDNVLDTNITAFALAINYKIHST
ncbi:hypothetical protein [Xenorhabdus hominickii]|uniref:1-phosphatidylinositol phosphodiesterase n=1 Tax=Xenorhabdus hominickii TaxID=351679 RepID=A0A2G0QF97_XENHO|nr:hypothetical protein [Xenorhabdus hominickii]AOM41867.1 hypothetical protein A9255_15665 [Xenorhabdus hominickii]PHM57839.1 1-phosphatidylinositol phosphodiesterase [Xenorhabdus hominickii]